MNYLLWISAAVLFATLQSISSQQAKPIPTGEDLCKHSFHAYLCNPPKSSGRRRVYNGQSQGPVRTPNQNQLTGADSFPQGSRLRPDQPKVPEQPNLIPDTSNVFQADAYLPPAGSKPPPRDRNFFGDNSNQQSLSLLPPTEKPPPPPARETPRPTTRQPPPPPTPKPTTRPPPPPPPQRTRPPPPPQRPTIRPPPSTPKPTTRPTPPQPRPTPPPVRATPPPVRTTPRPRPTTLRPPPETPLRSDANQNLAVQVAPEKSKIDCGHSFHSFLCDTGKKSAGRRRTYNGQRPGAAPQGPNVIGANSFVQSERILPPTTRAPAREPQPPPATLRPYVKPENTFRTTTPKYVQGSSLLGENTYLQPSRLTPPQRNPPPVPAVAAPYRPAPPSAKPRYEPEVQPAAAQNPSVRISPDTYEKSDGCKHAFHSYLCDTPKGNSQRRVYNGQRSGTSPQNPNVIGQNSFLQPSKILPPQEKTTTPPPFVGESSLLLSANIRPNANTYLPPPPPTPTYLPPKVVKPPPNNNLFGENSFLDPSRLLPPTQKPIPPPVKKTSPQTTTPRPTTPRATTPRPTTPRPTTPRPTTPRSTTPRPTTPRPRPQPDIRGDAAQSPSVQIRPDQPEKKENCGHSFHSFLCEPPKSGGRRRVYNGRKPDITPQNTNFIGENSFLQPEKVSPPRNPEPPTGGSLLIAENSFPQGAQTKPNANTYLPPPQPTKGYLPPVPKGPPTNINFFGDDSFLDPTKLRAPTPKPQPTTRPPPTTTVRTTTQRPTTPYKPVPRPTTTTTTPRSRPPPEIIPDSAQNSNVQRRPDAEQKAIDNHAFHSYLYQKPKSGGRRVYNGRRPTRSLGVEKLSPPRRRRVTRQVAAPADEHHHHHDDHHGDHGAHGAHGDHHGADHHHHHHNITLEQLCRDPFHAFLCDPVDTSRRQVYDGERYTPDKRGRIKGKIFGAGSIVHTKRVRPEPNSLVGGFINHVDGNSQISIKTQTLTQKVPSFSQVTPKQNVQSFVFEKKPETPKFIIQVNPAETFYTKPPTPTVVQNSPPVNIPQVKIIPSPLPSQDVPTLNLDSFQNIRTALLAERVETPKKDSIHHSISDILQSSEPRDKINPEVVLQPIEVRRPKQYRPTPPPFASDNVPQQPINYRKSKIVESNQDAQNTPQYNAGRQRQRPQRRRRLKPRPFAQESAQPVGRQETFDSQEKTTHTPIHRNRYFDSLHTWQDGPVQRTFGEKVRQRRLPEGESNLGVVLVTPVSPAVFARGPRGISARHFAGELRTKREEQRVFTGQGRASVPEDGEVVPIQRDNKHVQKIQKRVRPEIKEEKVTATEKSVDQKVKTKTEEKRVFTGQGRLPAAEEEEKDEKKDVEEGVTTTTEDPLVVYHRGIEAEQKRRDDDMKAREEEQKRRDDELKAREEEGKRRDEEDKRRKVALEKEKARGTTEDPHIAYQKEVDAELKRREVELKAREDEQKRRDEEAERRKAQELEVEKESERRKAHQKLLDDELERRKEEQVRVKLEEQRRERIKELDDD